ncbi:MAG TPA: SDR family oxidoreductase [Tepidisphaeraceae bacterium]|jgi:2-deoxy-D-gluconate 3-dehydrogenase
MSRFTNSVAIITGSSRGIGAAIAGALSREGATVVGVARTASELKLENYVPMDFDLGSASVAQINALVDRILSTHKKINILVNNAGIIRRAPAHQFSEQDWDDVLRINLKAPFFLTQAVARWWIERGAKENVEPSRLKIVNIASLLSFQGGITVPAYAASKHGIAGMTKALANEWAAQRINVNAVAPGYIATENTKALREDASRNAAILGRIPQGHWGEPQEIAGACLFLASRDADYVNGAVLNVDGGWLGR